MVRSRSASEILPSLRSDGGKVTSSIFRLEQEYFKGTPTTFLGMLTGEPLHQAFASADVFLMPSESETLGFVVLEAMASGVPVVAVAAGGIVDIITEPGKVRRGCLPDPTHMTHTPLRCALSGDGGRGCGCCLAHTLHRSAVPSSQSGMLYKPGDVEAAAAHVRDLIADSALAQQISSYGRQEVEKWRAHLPPWFLS